LGASRICRQRHAKGWTQKKTAEAAGLSLRTYRALERGEIFDPGIRQLSNLAAAFECSLEELFEPAWLSPTDFTRPRRSNRTW
jgi:putative transcriptional regulator